MYSKEEAYAKISDLVERFSLQIESYKKSDYNETLTLQDFINPFFKALGWDIDNSQGNAEGYRARIQYTDDKINKLVYELYNLTPEEIKIIESGIK